MRHRKGTLRNTNVYSRVARATGCIPNVIIGRAAGHFRRVRGGHDGQNAAGRHRLCRVSVIDGQHGHPVRRRVRGVGALVWTWFGGAPGPRSVITARGHAAAAERCPERTAAGAHLRPPAERGHHARPSTPPSRPGDCYPRSPPRPRPRPSQTRVITRNHSCPDSHPTARRLLAPPPGGPALSPPPRAPLTLLSTPSAQPHADTPPNPVNPARIPSAVGTHRHHSCLIRARPPADTWRHSSAPGDPARNPPPPRHPPGTHSHTRQPPARNPAPPAPTRHHSPFHPHPAPSRTPTPGAHSHTPARSPPPREPTRHLRAQRPLPESAAAGTTSALRQPGHHPKPLTFIRPDCPQQRRAPPPHPATAAPSPPPSGASTRNLVRVRAPRETATTTRPSVLRACEPAATRHPASTADPDRL